MEWAYVWEVMSKEDRRSNQPIFIRINELNLDDEHAFFDNTTDRPERAMMFEQLQTGDRLSVRAIQDLADSSRELLDVLQRLSDKGIVLWSCEEPYFSGADYLTIWNRVYEINNFYKEQARKKGYEQARQKGTVGRPKRIEKIEQAVKLYRLKTFTMEQIEEQTGVSRSTLYRHLKKISDKC